MIQNAVPYSHANVKFPRIQFRKLPTSVSMAYIRAVKKTTLIKLSGNQNKILDYVLTRTVFENSEGAIICPSEFKDGCVNHNGTGIARNKIYKELDVLRALGLIVTKLRGCKLFVWVNLAFTGHDLMREGSWSDKYLSFDWWSAHFTKYNIKNVNTNDADQVASVVDELITLRKEHPNKYEECDMLRKSKKDKASQNNEPARNRKVKLVSTNNTPQSLDQITSNDNQKRLAERLSKAVAARPIKKKAVKTKCTASMVEPEWKKGIAELYDENYAVSSWTIKDKGMVNTLIKRLDMSPDNTIAFFGYVAENWSSIIDQYFPWVDKNTREMPSVKFIAYRDRSNGFLASWNMRDDLDIGTRMSRSIKTKGGVGKTKVKKENIHQLVERMEANPFDVDTSSPEFIQLPPAYKLRINRAINRMQSTGEVIPLKKPTLIINSDEQNEQLLAEAGSLEFGEWK